MCYKNEHHSKNKVRGTRQCELIALLNAFAERALAQSDHPALLWARALAITVVHEASGSPQPLRLLCVCVCSMVCGHKQEFYRWLTPHSVVSVSSHSFHQADWHNVLMWHLQDLHLFMCINYCHNGVIATQNQIGHKCLGSVWSVCQCTYTDTSLHCRWEILSVHYDC